MCLSVLTDFSSSSSCVTRHLPLSKRSNRGHMGRNASKWVLEWCRGLQGSRGGPIPSLKKGSSGAKVFKMAPEGSRGSVGVSRAPGEGLYRV